MSRRKSQNADNITEKTYLEQRRLTTKQLHKKLLVNEMKCEKRKK